MSEAEPIYHPPAGGHPLPELAKLAERCRACPLWEHATHVVFGEGSANARVMVIGEQPGNSEDLSGKPFVGPAGKLLDRALAEAGIDRAEVYVTNAVKHFKWIPRGKVRLHQKPNAGEIEACKPWLMAEMSEVAPEILILLGATAARSVLGPKVKVTKDRGLVSDAGMNARVILTVHPSFLLRVPDARRKAAEYARFADDLRLAVS
jgi:uracil-DNA glycosylase